MSFNKKSENLNYELENISTIKPPSQSLNDYFTQIIKNVVINKKFNDKESLNNIETKNMVKLNRIEKPFINKYLLIEQTNNKQNFTINEHFTNFKDDANNLNYFERNLKNIENDIIDSTISTPFVITPSLELALSTEIPDSYIKNNFEVN